MRVPFPAPSGLSVISCSKQHFISDPLLPPISNYLNPAATTVTSLHPTQHPRSLCRICEILLTSTSICCRGLPVSGASCWQPQGVYDPYLWCVVHKGSMTICVALVTHLTPTHRPSITGLSLCAVTPVSIVPITRPTLRGTQARSITRFVSPCRSSHGPPLSCQSRGLLLPHRHHATNSLSCAPFFLFLN